MSFSKELITVLDYLAQKLGIVIDWTAESVKPYLEDLCARYIEYEIFNSFIIIGGWLLVLLVSVPFLIPSTICARKNDWDGGYPSTYLSVVSWIVFIVSVIGLVGCTIAEGFDIIECWKMPEKVIIEYIKSLLENSK